uniref:HPt domain-containing protein n=2 Tax=Choreotrichia TaxID=141411 RepID=A0A7S3X9L1_9SPIT
MGGGLGSSLADGQWKSLLCPAASKEVDPLVTFEHLKGLSPQEVLGLVEPFFETAIESLTKIEVRLKGGGKAKQAVHRMAGDAMYVGAKGFGAVMRFLEDELGESLSGDEGITTMGKSLCGSGPGASQPFEILGAILLDSEKGVRKFLSECPPDQPL